MIKAWAQLFRLPNIFTAIADVLAGALLALGRWPEGHEVWLLLRLCLASACLYSAGMVLNDYFDVEEDTRERPFRPIPSGRVPRKLAGAVGLTLLILGVFSGTAWDSSRILRSANWIAPALAGLIFAYDGWLKRTPLGPLAMGGCRFLNILLGAVHFDPMEMGMLWVAGIIGCYIIGVTYFARSEVKANQRGELVAGLGLILFTWLLLIAFPILGLMTNNPFQSILFSFLALAVVWMLVIGFSLWRALRTPEPRFIQLSVKCCIFGLVGLDAILAFAAVGPTGLSLLALLIPAVVLGRYVYST